jgi:hypothetical protein
MLSFVKKIWYTGMKLETPIPEGMRASSIKGYGVEPRI